MRLPLLTFLGILALGGHANAAEAPLYANDFESAELGKLPADFMLMAGVFKVKQEGDGKVLELPGEPLDSFGILFGPSEKAEITASARFFGTSKGRKFPTFGLSLNGVAGYRLQVSPGKKALEIYKGDEVRQTVPFAWNSGSWTTLRLEVRATAGGVAVAGKAWTAGEAEPPQWTISVKIEGEPAPGRAGIWGSPYSGTPILFDDLLLNRASAP
jgi:hypothetical protein